MAYNNAHYTVYINNMRLLNTKQNRIHIQLQTALLRTFGYFQFKKKKKLFKILVMIKFDQ